MRRHADLIAIPDDLSTALPSAIEAQGAQTRLRCSTCTASCRAAGGAILYAARHTSRAATGIARAFATAAFATLGLGKPLDDDGRRELLRRRQKQHVAQLGDAVIDYLLRRFDRDLSSSTALLERLDEVASPPAPYHPYRSCGSFCELN
ncbi:MAG: hypothetical protein H7A20_04820 [Rhodanobacteraceae bacterium]|nr:hypothetical protein [Rhodanobacteraceae bacterium]